MNNILAQFIIHLSSLLHLEIQGFDSEIIFLVWIRNPLDVLNNWPVPARHTAQCDLFGFPPE